MTHPSLSDRPRIAVLTMVAGDHDHLMSHVDGLTLSTWPPEVHVAVSVRDRALTRGRLPIRCDRWATEVPVLAVARRTTFLPALRLATDRALPHRPDVLVYLSVHCIPAPRLLQALAEEAVAGQGDAPRLWYGHVVPLAAAPAPYYPVRDLDDLVTDESGAGATFGSADEATWGHAFAMTTSDWEALWPRLEAVCPATSTPSTLHEGILAAGATLHRVDGALAYRQHPPTADTGTLTGTG